MTKGQSEAGQIHGGQSQGTAGRSNDRNIAPMGKVTSSGASTTERSDELGATTTEKPYTGELLRMNGEQHFFASCIVDFLCSDDTDTSKVTSVICSGLVEKAWEHQLSRLGDRRASPVTQITVTVIRMDKRRRRDLVAA